VVLVVGSGNSSNSVRLVELSRRRGTPAYLIDDASGIQPEWIEHARVVGVTAGASAPPHLVDEVIDYLNARGPVTVREVTAATETIRFALPSQLRTGAKA
jgi:4-hydroxy-3-methylbut-2-enyl diphosphate reductase